MEKGYEGTSKPFRMFQYLNGSVIMRTQGGDAERKPIEDCDEELQDAVRAVLKAAGKEFDWEGGVVGDINTAADALVQAPIDAKADREAKLAAEAEAKRLADIEAVKDTAPAVEDTTKEMVG